MISQIAAIRTAFPSAFSALGVGALALVGMLPAGLLLRAEFGGIDLSKYVLSGSLLGNALPFLIAAGAFFYTYAMGMAFISMGSRLRGETPFNDVQRLYSVLENKNELFIKYFFEQKSTIEMFDGIAVGLGFSVAMTSMPLAVVEEQYLYGALVLFFGIGLSFAMFRESRYRVKHLELLLSIYSAKQPELISQSDSAF